MKSTKDSKLLRILDEQSEPLESLQGLGLHLAIPREERFDAEFVIKLKQLIKHYANQARLEENQILLRMFDKRNGDKYRHIFKRAGRLKSELKKKEKNNTIQRKGE